MTAQAREPKRAERCGKPEFHYGMNEQRRFWASGWRRFVFPGLWLVYLTQTVSGVAKHSHGLAAAAGYAIVAAFAAIYLICLPMAWSDRRQAWVPYTIGWALLLAELYFAHQDATVMGVYLVVMTIAIFPRRAAPVIIAMTLLTFLLPWVIPSWGGRPDGSDALAVLLVAFAMWGFFGLMQSNLELSAARAEVGRLAAESERTRIARDLHDLLGHSLTTITVKSGLARRLAERGELDRAAAEIAEVEGLSRRTLGEVRAAVAGYRDVTLAGELASARDVLHAAGIEPILPGAVDIAEEDTAVTFGWVLREAVTNVVRHSRASRCTVTLGPRWIEIIDDGVGAKATASDAGGNGLHGLAERVADAGGTVRAEPYARGWRVRAELPSMPDVTAPAATGTARQAPTRAATPRQARSATAR